MIEAIREEWRRKRREGGGRRAGGALRETLSQPSLHFTAACCHGGAKMAVLAYSPGKREINQYFSIRNAKLISLVVVLLLLLFHTASRYYGGESLFEFKLNS